MSEMLTNLRSIDDGYYALPIVRPCQQRGLYEFSDIAAHPKFLLCAVPLTKMCDYAVADADTTLIG